MPDPLYLRAEIIKDIYRQRAGEITYEELLERARAYCALCEQTYARRNPTKKPIKFDPAYVIRNLV